MNITFYDIAKTKTIAATLERDRTYIAERLREPTRFVTTLRTTEPLQLPTVYSLPPTEARTFPPFRASSAED